MCASTPAQIRVLCVADDPNRAESTAAALARGDSRFNVEIVTSAQEGIATVRDQPPDCVVSGYDLPEGDGLGFLRAVRETQPELPFILYTDSGSEAVASEAISAGVTDYLRRGTDSGSHEQLVRRVENAVSAREMPTDLDEPQQAMAAVAVLRVDSTGEIVFANQQASERLGVETGELTGRPYTDLPWESASEQANDPEWPFRRVLELGDSVDAFRCDVVLPDGTARTVEISGVPVPDDSGDTGSGVFTVAGATATAERLRELERREAFLEHSPDFLTVLTETGTVEYQSQIPGHINEFDPQNMVGGTAKEYIHPDDWEQAQHDFGQILGGDLGETVRTEFRFSVASGEYRWFENWATNYLDHDPVDGILVVTRDITERKEAEQSLADYATTVTRLQKATRRLLETTDIEEAAAITVENTREAFDCDAAGIWRSTGNRTRLEPVAIAENRQTSIGDPPTYSAETRSLSWEAFETGEIRVIDDMADYESRHNPETSIQSELIVPLGEYGLINVGSTERAAFDDQDARRIEIWGNVVESALARLTQIERLERREQELQRERNRLNEFASFVSHDLRNPLQVAKGRLQMVADEHTSPHLSDIEQALDRMDQLIEDVLELARQGATVGETEPVPLQQLLSQCWNNVGTATAELNVRTACTIRADDSRLASALENLFRNAVEHAGEDVTVTVGTLDDASGLYVADDGPGIPPSERDSVFESGYSTEADGTGLGLQIVQQIVDAHDWEVRVCKSDAGGARFEITGIEFD
jgi:PAS domain S-box-containing protein